MLSMIIGTYLRPASRHRGKIRRKSGRKALVQLEGSCQRTCRVWPTLAVTVLDKMRERIDASPRHIGVLCQVAACGEGKARVAALLPSIAVIMLQRVHSGGSNIRILFEVKAGIKPWVRIAGFLPSELLEVLGGVDIRSRYVRVRCPVESFIDKRIGLAHRMVIDHGRRIGDVITPILPNIFSDVERNLMSLGVVVNPEKVLSRYGGLEANICCSCSCRVYLITCSIIKPNMRRRRAAG